jgi:hypothetical protein
MAYGMAKSKQLAHLLTPAERHLSIPVRSGASFNRLTPVRAVSVAALSSSRRCLLPPAAIFSQ